MPVSRGAEIALRLNELERDRAPMSEMDAQLSVVVDSNELIAVIDAVDVHMTIAKSLFRAAQRTQGAALEHAKWLLAGALSLQGEDDLARAVEPRQQETGFVKMRYSMTPPSGSR